jgi:hypothetical protein
MPSTTPAAEASVVAYTKRWASLKQAVIHAPIGRSSLYKLASQHPGLFRKWNDKTIVDLPMLDQIMAECPLATINPPAPRKIKPPTPKKPSRRARP